MDYEIDGEEYPWVNRMLDDLQFGIAKEWMEEILKYIYETPDMDELENALGELAAVFELKLPDKNMIIREDSLESLRRVEKNIEDTIREI